MARLSPEEGLRTLEDRNESWRPIHPAYAVSDYGRVKRTLGGPGAQVGKILKTNTTKRGYHYVVLCHSGMRKTCMVHGLVAGAFHGSRPKGCEVNHEDGNKDNNRADNLEYVDPWDNIQHAMEHGLRAVGARHGRAKLDENSVVDIKRQLDAGGSPTEISKKFGVKRSAISKILHGRTWAHVVI